MFRQGDFISAVKIENGCFLAVKVEDYFAQLLNKSLSSSITNLEFFLVPTYFTTEGPELVCRIYIIQIKDWKYLGILAWVDGFAL